MHTAPELPGSQPCQLPKTEPVLAVAVKLTVVPVAKLPIQGPGLAQVKPEGMLVIIPEPTPLKFTVRVEVLLPPGQITLAFMDEVTIAPLEVRVPTLLVCTVAETVAFPQAVPPGESNPLEVTVTT